MSKINNLLIFFIIAVVTPKILTQGNQNTYLCNSGPSLFLEKTPYILNSLNQLLCVDGNNSQSMYEYLEPLTNGKNQKSIEDILEKASILHESSSSINEYSPLSYYTNKDHVSILSKDNFLGYLSLPTQLTTDPSCSYRSRIRYMEDKHTQCIVPSNLINLECSQSNVSSLSLKYFLNGFKIIRRPGALNDCYQLSGNTGTISLYDTCSNDFLLTINIRQCKYNDGTVDQNCMNNIANLLSPNFNGNQCKNLIKSVSYFLKYNNPLGLIEAAIDVEFFDIDLSAFQNKFIQQTFNVRFVQNYDDSPLKNFLEYEKLSGNPGYQLDEPIQAGPDSNKPLVSDRNKRFTFLKAYPNGDCPSDDSLRETVRFNFDVSSQCYKNIEIDAPLDENKCNTIQSQINSIILGFDIDRRPLYFAEYATSTNRSNWREIKEAFPNFKAILNKNTCTFIVGTDLIISYALVGNTRDPQKKIIYISYRWNDNLDVKFKCDAKTKKCSGRAPIKIRITFLDISQESFYKESKLEIAASYLPVDFFYPFSNSSFLFPNYNLIAIIIILVKIFLK